MYGLQSKSVKGINGVILGGKTMAHTKFRQVLREYDRNMFLLPHDLRFEGPRSRVYRV